MKRYQQESKVGKPFKDLVRAYRDDVRLTVFVHEKVCEIFGSANVKSFDHDGDDTLMVFLYGPVQPTAEMLKLVWGVGAKRLRTFAWQGLDSVVMYYYEGGPVEGQRVYE